jgi:hypothetical protein
VKATGWLVIQKRGASAVIARVTRGRPTLNYNEARIKLTLEIPDDLFDNPALTVPVDRFEAEVAAEVAHLEEAS